MRDLAHSKGPRLLHKTCAKHSSRASGLEVRKTRARNLETCGRGEGEGEGRGREGKGGEGRGRERKGGEGGTSGQVASRPGRSRIQIGDLQFRILLCQKSQKTEGKKKKTKKNKTNGPEGGSLPRKWAPPFPRLGAGPTAGPGLKTSLLIRPSTKKLI